MLSCERDYRASFLDLNLTARRLRIVCEKKKIYFPLKKRKNRQIKTLLIGLLKWKWDMENSLKRMKPELELIKMQNFFAGDPLYVGMDMTIASFDSISEVNMVRKVVWGEANKSS